LAYEKKPREIAMNDEEKKGLEYKTGMTPKAFLVGIILVIFLIIYGNLAGGFSRDPMMREATVAYATYTFLIMFILAVISPLLKNAGFTISELVVIYTMVGGALFVPILPQIGTAVNWPIFLILLSPFPIEQITPSIWFPPESVMRPMLTGGALVPWGAWITPLTFWIVLVLSIMGFITSFGLILSHRLIDVERLQYPWAHLMMEMIEKSQSPQKEKFAAKSIIAGFIIGFLIEGSFDLFPDIIPGFPRFWSAYMGQAGIYRIDLGPLIGPATSNMAVWFPVGHIAFLAPLFFFSTTKILGSALLTWFVVWDLIPLIEVKMGIMTNVCALGLYDMTPIAVNYFGTLFEPSPIQILSFASLGFLFGMALTYILLSGKDIAISFKAAVKGEKIGQINDRIAWLGFIGSIIIFLALTSLSEIPLHVGLFIMAISLLCAHGWQRARGYITFDRTDYNAHTGPWGLTDPTAMLLGTEAGTTASYASTMIMAGSIWGLITTPINYVVLDGLRLCELTKTKWEDVVKSGVIAAIVAVIIGFLVMIWGAYSWGFQAGFAGYWADPGPANTIAAYQFGGISHMYSGVSPTRVFPDMVAGIIVAAIITLLSYYLPWFPVHPAGLVFGAQLLFPAYHLGAVAIAFIMKVLVLKVGGEKLYKKAVPVVIGIMIGAGVSMLLYGFTLLAKI